MESPVMAVLTVGLHAQFTTIAAAVAAAASGDTINVTADHTYTNDFFAIEKSLTLNAVGGEVHIVATVAPSNGKAAIVEGAAGLNITINGFDISGVKVADANGAAIRYEGGALTLTNDYFHNNQEGLLGNGADIHGTITVRHSEFAFNGDGSGFTHNFYAGHIAAVTIDDSYFHDAVVGHEIKSRAISTTITNSRIFDNASTASYSIDAPNGGALTVANDVIEQGANSENFYIIAYGEEGATNAGAATIRNNTIVNDRATARGVLSSSPVPFTGNSVFGLPDLGSVSASGNTVLVARPALNLAPMSFITAPPPVVTPPPPPPPPPPLTLAQYHTLEANEFITYATAHPAVWSNPTALAALEGEVLSTTVLAHPLPGDLWSPQ
jgi:hypothetical protein